MTEGGSESRKVGPHVFGACPPAAAARVAADTQSSAAAVPASVAGAAAIALSPFQPLAADLQPAALPEHVRPGKHPALINEGGLMIFFCIQCQCACQVYL